MVELKKPFVLIGKGGMKTKNKIVGAGGSRNKKKKRGVSKIFHSAPHQDLKWNSPSSHYSVSRRGSSFWVSCTPLGTNLYQAKTTWFGPRKPIYVTYDKGGFCSGSGATELSKPTLWIVTKGYDCFNRNDDQDQTYCYAEPTRWKSCTFNI